MVTLFFHGLKKPIVIGRLETKLSELGHHRVSMVPRWSRGFFGGFDAEVLDQLRPQRAPPLLALAVLLALASFLAIGPFVGATWDIGNTQTKTTKKIYRIMSLDFKY